MAERPTFFTPLGPAAKAVPPVFSSTGDSSTFIWCDGSTVDRKVVLKITRYNRGEPTTVLEYVIEAGDYYGVVKSM